MKFATVILSFLLASATAYNANSGMNRRDVFRSVASAGVAAAFVSSPPVANALEACLPGTSNCIRTTWTPPAGTSKADATSTLMKVLQSYPQEGQNKVDLGGWKIVEDNFDSGSARIEYTSGLGNFAKFLNGGKPFVDDLKLEVADSGVVEVRSSSRIGESDFKVNQKRLNFFGEKFIAEGWSAPEAKY